MEWLRYNWFKLVGVAAIVTAAMWYNGISWHQVFSGKITGSAARPGGTYGNAEGVSEVYSSTVVGQPKYALHILFIGNSFTFFHDIPRQLTDIASSDPGNPTQFFVQSVTRGGITLKELWEDGKAAETLRAVPWNYVVVQEVSDWALSAGKIKRADYYVKQFDALVKAGGAKTILYLTWPNKPGSAVFSDPQYRMRSPDYVLSRFIAETYRLAGEIDASTADVGVYWSRLLKKYPEIELYEADAHHPSMAGSYLAALVFYKTLTGRDIARVTFVPPGVAPEAAAKIRNVVAGPLS